MIIPTNKSKQKVTFHDSARRFFHKRFPKKMKLLEMATDVTIRRQDPLDVESALNICKILYRGMEAQNRRTDVSCLKVVSIEVINDEKNDLRVVVA